MLRPHPIPSLYRWPGGPLGAIGGGGVPLGLLLPKGNLPTRESESKEDSSHMWRPHHLDFGQPPWGALPPKAKGGGAHMVMYGTLWNLPKASRTFHDLPGPAGTILGHSGTFRDGFGTFRNLLENFQDLPGPFSDVLELS